MSKILSLVFGLQFFAILLVSLFNISAGIISGLWLIFIGDWEIVVSGFIYSIVSPFILGFIMMIGLIFYPGALLLNKGRYFLGSTLLILSQLFNIIVIFTSVTLVFNYYGQFIEKSGLIPILFFAYAVSFTPWSYMAQTDREAGNDQAHIEIFLGQIGFVFGMIIFIFSGYAIAMSIGLLFGLLAGSILNSIVAIQEHQKTTPIRNDNNHASVNMKINKTPGKFRVLFVDDDKFLRDMYRKTLEDWGFEVIELENAAGDFTTRVAEINPDIIFLDIVMPGRDGFEAIRLLKTEATTKEIPVIFESNMGQKESIERGINLKANDYLVISQITPSSLALTAKNYLDSPDDYISRYPIFLAAIESIPLKGDHEKEYKKRSDYIESQMKALEEKIYASGPDPIYDGVRNFVIKTGHKSTDKIQRKFKIGYARASVLIDKLEKDGVI